MIVTSITAPALPPAAIERNDAATARDRLALDTDDVAELRIVDRGEQFLADTVGAGEQLDPIAAILEIEERRLAHQPPAQHAPGEPVALPRRRTGLEIAMRCAHLGDLGAVGEAVGKKVESGGSRSRRDDGC